jgi:hypothetical protein
VEYGDACEVKGKSSPKLRVRCFQPQKHKNGDAHPSAVYHLGKCIYCPVCGFKESERRLAQRLGISNMEGGLTLQGLAEAKGLPVEFLQKWGWRTQKSRDGRAAVLIPWYDEQGVMKHAPAYHVRHYISKGDDDGPRFTWDIPRSVELRPYGVWRIQEWLEEAKESGITPYMCLVESELDCLVLWLHGIPACATGGCDGWRHEWTEYFSLFQKIIIFQEPGSPGLEMVKLIGNDLIKLNRPEEREKGEALQILACPFSEELKDADAIHLSVHGDTVKFRLAIQELVKKAVTVADILARQGAEEKEKAEKEKEEERQRLLELAKPLLDDPSIRQYTLLRTWEWLVSGEMSDSCTFKCEVGLSNGR